MRSHAKASTAGSTQGQATGLGCILRGGLAIRGASLEVKGSGASKSRRLALPLVLLVAVFSLALGVGSASAVVPTIPSTSVSAVTTKAALLEAEINPEGEATTYHFEYGPADCSSNPCTSAPVPNGNVGSASKVVKVTEEIEGLDSGTTYHFRVLATNGSGTAQGQDHTFTTFALTQASSCPNQAFRIGPGATLPDCRAYEMVSPVDKNGGDSFAFFEPSLPRTSFNQSAVDGNKFTYTASAVFGDQLSGRGANQYMATRGPGGWATHGINAPRGKTITPPELFIDLTGDAFNQFKMFTPDLSSAWITDNNEEPLTPDASQGYVNLYRRDNFNDSYEALTMSAPTSKSGGIEGNYAQMAGQSRDASHVVFENTEALTPDAAAGANWQIYDYSNGELHLVSVLPSGVANSISASVGTAIHHQSEIAEPTAGMVSHAVSDDGSRIFWTSGKGPGTLYVRENPAQPQSALNGSGECIEPTKACTLLVAGGTNQFWAASADGSKVLYSGGGTLNVFNVDAETTTPIAGEVGGVAGASDDLSYVYFTSEENLDAGATAGEMNVYLDHQGTISFIATLSLDDRKASYGPGTIDGRRAIEHATRVTPDGRHLAFMSNRSLTGYDNTDALNGKADMEVYLYDAGSDELTCVSCNPSGARPVGQEMIKPYWPIPFNFPQNPDISSETGIWAGAWLQTWVYNVHQSHALSDDGNRLFFNSFDALVPQDTNGAQDVYQWEAQGLGTCQKAGGCVSLISTGESQARSEFVDATPDGSNVFIETSSSIDPRDPGLIDIYDARVNGGFPIPPSPPECVGDSCQNIPLAPNDATPASAGFKGAGNSAPAKPRRRCRARSRHAGKGKHRARHKKAKRCKPAKQETAR